MKDNLGKVHKVSVLDASTLEPEDRVSVLEKNKNSEELSKTKRIIGRPKVYDLDGNLLAEEENLVVMGGREIVAALISGRNSTLDNYKIEYFGVGSGGTVSASGSPSTIGPYDNDTSLSQMAQIGSPTLSDKAENDFKYIGNGVLKKIVSDGKIEIKSETHTINGPTGEIQVNANTVIVYTLMIQKDEPVSKPFKFNEAGLFAVEYNASGIPSKDNHILFARFTTLDKYLDIHDGIVIEWSILV